MRVDIEDLVHARTRSLDDLTEVFLDLTTGEVLWSVDEAITGIANEVEVILEKEPERLVLIGREEGHESWSRMHAFAATHDNRRVGEALLAALDGKGAFRRFRAVLSRHPEVRAQWDETERAGHALKIEAWLAGLGIRAVFVSSRAGDRPRWPPGI